MKKLTFSDRASMKFHRDPDSRLAQLPVLIEILRQPLNGNLRDIRTRIRAAYALALLSPKDVLPAKEALLGILMNPEDPISPVSVEIINSLGPSEETIPALLCQLKAESYSSRERAACMLGCIGPKAACAIPALSSALEQDIFRLVRAGVVEALGKIGSPLALPALNKALKDDYESVRLLARDAIAAVVDQGR